MENLVYCNLGKLPTFVFGLRIDIEKVIKLGIINDSDDCIEYITNRVISSNIFQYSGDVALRNIVNQLFMFLYCDETLTELPIIEKYKELSKLN